MTGGAALFPLEEQLLGRAAVALRRPLPEGGEILRDPVVAIGETPRQTGQFAESEGLSPTEGLGPRDLGVPEEAHHGGGGAIRAAVLAHL